MAETGKATAVSETLYDRCSKEVSSSDEKYKKIFNQDALLALCIGDTLGHIKDAKDLMPLVQELSASGLFITLKTKTSTCWSLRPREAAQKLHKLSSTERTVYTLIEEASESGIWIRTLKNKIGIKDGKAMDKMLANMQRMGLVKDVTNIKSAAKKYYMLAHLVPSDEITGGSFYDAGEMDEGLIEELGNLIVFHVRQMSWVEERESRKKKVIKREPSSSPVLVRDDEPLAPPTTGVEGGAGKDANARKKRKRDSMHTSQSKDIEDSAPPRKHRHRRQSHDPEIEIQLAFSAGHEYPTATSIHDYITSNNILRGPKATHLSVNEVQSVLNLLVWDAKLELVNGGYRSVRGVKFKQPGEEEDAEETVLLKRGNGFTEMPCGQCPVFDICGTGGPVNAESCVYFDRWLGVGVAGEVV